MPPRNHWTRHPRVHEDPIWQPPNFYAGTVYYNQTLPPWFYTAPDPNVYHNPTGQPSDQTADEDDCGFDYCDNRCAQYVGPTLRGGAGPASEELFNAFERLMITAESIRTSLGRMNNTGNELENKLRTLEDETLKQVVALEKAMLGLKLHDGVSDDDTATLTERRSTESEDEPCPCLTSDDEDYDDSDGPETPGQATPESQESEVFVVTSDWDVDDPGMPHPATLEWQELEVVRVTEDWDVDGPEIPDLATPESEILKVTSDWDLDSDEACGTWWARWR